MTKRRSISTIITFALAGLALLLSGLSVPASAATTGGVKGVISSGGTTLPGLKVELTRLQSDDDHYDSIASRTTTSSGAYSFAGLPENDPYGEPYRYRIKVSDPSGAYVTTIRDIGVLSGEVVTRNATMVKAGALTGKVLRADGAAPTTTRVHLIGPNVEVGTPDKPELAYDDDRGVSADGTYTFSGLPAGDYTVRYTDTTGTYLDQCYDDVIAAQSYEPTCDSDEAPAAEVVTVTATETTTLDDQQLHHAGAHLSGTVTTTASTPLDGIQVTPYAEADDSGPWGDSGLLTSAAGAFHRGPLPAGLWKVLASDPAGIWAAQWVGGSSRADATVFDLDPGEKAEGISIKLKSRAVLTVRTTAGAHSVALAVTVTRKATGSFVSGGQVTATLGETTKSATLSGGMATIRLSGLTAGKHTFTIRFGGNANTSVGTRNITATIG